MADLKISQLTGATTPLAGTEVLPVVQSNTTKKVSVESILTSVQPSGTANGVVYLNGSKVATSGTALSYDGTSLTNTYNIYAFSGTNISDIAFGVGKSLTNTNSAFFGWRYNVGAPYAYVETYGQSIPLQIGASTISFQTGSVDRLKFETTGDVTVKTGNLVQGTAAKGINFTANTPAAGMTSQLLNWYEEGTWTPVVAGSSTAGTATYSFQNGRYTRIGRQVFIELFVVYSGGTGTGSLTITGLPFTASNAAVYPSFAIGTLENIVITAGATPMAYVDNNSSRIFIQQIPSGGGTASLVSYDAAGSIALSGCYSV